MGRRRRGLWIGLCAVALAALVLSGALGAGASEHRAALTIRVSGDGSVLVRPGGRRCSTRCVVSVHSGRSASLSPRAAWGNQFARWFGPCSPHPRRARCVVRLARHRTVRASFIPIRRLVSWNPFYKCRPILTTIPFILGSQRDAEGGATEAGGGLQPHLRGSEDQHLLQAPCQVGGTGTFVEIHDVVVSENPERSGDGDEVVNMSDPNRPDITDIYMKTIHTEIDNSLITHHVAPPIQPRKGTHIDIQGFVFWDPAHTGADWHSFSGWEIHTLTA